MRGRCIIYPGLHLQTRPYVRRIASIGPGKARLRVHSATATTCIIAAIIATVATATFPVTISIAVTTVTIIATPATATASTSLTTTTVFVISIVIPIVTATPAPITGIVCGATMVTIAVRVLARLHIHGFSTTVVSPVRSLAVRQGRSRSSP